MVLTSDSLRAQSSDDDFRSPFEGAVAQWTQGVSPPTSTCPEAYSPHEAKNTVPAE